MATEKKMKAAFILAANSDLESFYFDASIMQRITKYADIEPIFISKEMIPQYASQLREIEIIFSSWGMPSFTEQEIDQNFPNLKAVFYAAGTVQGFAAPFLKKDIIVTSSWVANAVPVAEQCVGVMLLASKGFMRAARIASTDGWRKSREYCSHLPGLFNVNISLLGFGQIARKVVELLKPYKVNCFVYDPYVICPEEYGVTQVATLEEAFQKGFIISNHIPNKPDNAKIINKKHFDLMDDYGVFINSGRGQQVDEEHLVAAMVEKPGRTAFLDVTFPEPPAPDSPLYTTENIFVTPHIYGSINKEVMRLMEYAVEDFENYAQGKPLNYQVTLKMLETMA